MVWTSLPPTSEYDLQAASSHGKTGNTPRGHLPKGAEVRPPATTARSSGPTGATLHARNRQTCRCQACFQGRDVFEVQRRECFQRVGHCSKDLLALWRKIMLKGFPKRIRPARLEADPALNPADCHIGIGEEPGLHLPSSISGQANQGL